MHTCVAMSNPVLFSWSTWILVEQEGLRQRDEQNLFGLGFEADRLTHSGEFSYSRKVWADPTRSARWPAQVVFGSILAANAAHCAGSADCADC